MASRCLAATGGDAEEDISEKSSAFPESLPSPCSLFSLISRGGCLLCLPSPELMVEENKASGKTSLHLTSMVFLKFDDQERALPYFVQGKLVWSLPSKKKEKHSDNWVDIVSVPKWLPCPVGGHVDSESSLPVATGCDSTSSPDSALGTPVPCWKAACSVLSAVMEIQMLKTQAETPPSLVWLPVPETIWAGMPGAELRSHCLHSCPPP